VTVPALIAPPAPSVPNEPNPLLLKALAPLTASR
jgi:hypothetical protein